MKKTIYTITLILVTVFILASCSSTDGFSTTPNVRAEKYEYDFKTDEEPPVPSKANVPPMFVPSGDPLPGGESMMPMRHINVLSALQLDSPLYSIVGTVEGKGRVNAENPEDGDTHVYGKLVTEEEYAVDYVSTEGTDPYAVSLSNAIADMISDAWEKGAAFVVFPSYIVDFTEDGCIETTVRAVGVGFNTTVAQTV